MSLAQTLSFPKFHTLSRLVGMALDKSESKRVFVGRAAVPCQPQTSNDSHTWLWLGIRFLAAALLALPFTALAFASPGPYCHQDAVTYKAAGGGKIQIAEFTVEVMPIEDPGSPGDMTCQASVTSPQGKRIFEVNERGVGIDSITGKDINGDGQPDAVLVGFSGGAHCCWTYYIVSLGQVPGLIRKFQNRSTASFEDLLGNGQIEILIRDGDFDFAFGLDHAHSVFPLLIVQLKGASFEDVGPRFWTVFEKEITREREELSDRRLREWFRSNPDDPYDNMDYLETKSRVLLVVLDYLDAGRYQEARSTLGKLSPPNSQEQIWNEMRTGYCSGLRTELKLRPVPICGER